MKLSLLVSMLGSLTNFATFWEPFIVTQPSFCEIFKEKLCSGKKTAYENLCFSMVPSRCHECLDVLSTAIAETFLSLYELHAETEEC